MDLLTISKNYLDLKNSWDNAKHKGAKEKGLFALKISSYLTIAIPIGMSITYAASKRAHNIKIIHEGEEILKSLNEGNYTKSSLLHRDVKKVCSASKKLFKKGNIENSQKFLNQIEVFNQLKKSQISEFIENLILIFKTQVKIGQNEIAFCTLEKIIKEIPTLSDSVSETKMYLGLAFLIKEINRKKAFDLIKKATECIDTYKNDSGNEVEYHTQETLNWLKKELQKTRYSLQS